MKVVDDIIEYDAFVVAVQRCRSLVEKEIVGFTINRPGDQHPLTLAFAKRKVLSSYRCVNTLGQLGYEVFDVCNPDGIRKAIDIVFRFGTQRNIFRDASREKVSILENDC